MRTLLSLLTLCSLCEPGLAEPWVVEEAGVIRSYTEEGDLRWQVECQGPCGGPLEVDASGEVRLGDRFRISRAGQVQVLPQAKPWLGKPRDGDLVWEEPAELIVSGLLPGESAVFDSLGNAWVVTTVGTIEERNVDVIQSEGHTNVWTTERIYTTSDDLSDGATAIDGSDVVTAVWRRLGGGLYRLETTRYVPGAGWGPVEIIHSESNFFQTVIAAADHVGNAVVGFDGEGSNAMWTVIYDARTQSWGEPGPLSLDANVIAPTLARNRDGTAVYAVYWTPSGLEPGIYASRFDSANAAWGKVVRLPGTTGASLQGFNDVDAEVPAAVDGEGNLTVLYYRTLPSGQPVLMSSRLKADGTFALPRPVAPGPEAQLLDETVHFVANDAGDLMFAYSRHVSSPTDDVFAVRYSGAQGRWQFQRRIWANNDNSSTGVSAAFLPSGAAVVAFDNRNAAKRRVSSRIFDGAMWQPMLTEVPGDWDVGTLESAWDGNDVLLLFVDGAVYATWLRGGTLALPPSSQ